MSATPCNKFTILSRKKAISWTNKISGFVGSRVVNSLRRKYDLITPSHSVLDITSAGDIERFIGSAKPDAILHLAAISNTGYCEEHPEESYLVNVVSIENLANSAAKHGCKLVFFS
jgi:dTDP-4-dehydrorhamnose reductase